MKYIFSLSVATIVLLALSVWSFIAFGANAGGFVTVGMSAILGTLDGMHIAEYKKEQTKNRQYIQKAEFYNLNEADKKELTDQPEMAVSQIAEKTVTKQPEQKKEEQEEKFQ